MQQPSKQGGERQPPSQTAAKVSKARTPLCAQEMGALPAGEEWESLSVSGGEEQAGTTHTKQVSPHHRWPSIPQSWGSNFQLRKTLFSFDAGPEGGMEPQNQSFLS